MRKKILYPIFLKIAITMNDTFWRFLYEDLSYGKCPYGIYIQNDILTCFLKDKEFSYKLDLNNENYITEIHNLLKYKAQILSEKEKIIEKEKKLNETNYTLSTNKKYIKENILQNFFILECRKYNVSIETCKKIICYIYIGFLLKLLNLKNIHFDEINNITKIDNVEFSNKKVTIKNNFLLNKNFKFNSNYIEIENKKNLSNLWTNYFQDFKTD
tara:strand:+ start:4956 stop:5597 length:642 start_codon:yes stop_codon:yes gene_type:complete